MSRSETTTSRINQVIASAALLFLSGLSWFAIDTLEGLRKSIEKLDQTIVQVTSRVSEQDGKIRVNSTRIDEHDRRIRGLEQ